LVINLLDNCGLPVNGAQITTTFSNGDLPVSLTPVDTVSGNYVGTWTPQGVSQQVTVMATATNGVYAQASAVVTGQVRTNNAPVLAQNGAVNAFNRLLGAGVAPGEIVEIYGTNLATQTVSATNAPLPISLGGTSVIIGGIEAPLYYISPGQIDAQIPYELTVGNQYQVQVNANGAITVPASVSIIPVAPGVAGASSAQVIAQHNADYSPVSEASPAKPGEFIVLYLDGLGIPDSNVPTGAPSPASPLAHPVVAPVLTLNGVSVPVYFAGLTPGAVGLYQIDLQIPANAPNGDLLLSIGQDAATSNVVILPVHQ
jgi:uncharacterized protein (TIGR03437 family)